MAPSRSQLPLNRLTRPTHAQIALYPPGAPYGHDWTLPRAECEQQHTVIAPFRTFAVSLLIALATLCWYTLHGKLAMLSKGEFMRIFTHFSRCGTPAALLRLRRARERGRLYFSLMNRASGQVDARRILSVAGAAAHPCRLKGGIPWHDARNPLRLLRRRSPSSPSDAAAHALARRTRAAVAWQSARSTARSSSPASAQKVGALS